MSAWASKAPEKLEAWRQLGVLAEDVVASPKGGTANGLEVSERLGPLLVDYSKQRLNERTMRTLVALAHQSGLPAAIASLFAGEAVNTTENRAALHTALRSPAGITASPLEIHNERRRFLAFAEDVRDGTWKGYDGRAAATVVHIGIGGSHLGPELIVDAMAQAATGPEIRFLANIDGNAARTTLAGLDPATTLAMVASKSFNTLETALNAATVKSWFWERTCNAAAVARHFAAATANTAAAAEFGIPQANCFRLWNWVGGRFSLWSAVGLPIAIALGRQAFEDLLAGAHAVDEHFRTTPLARNIPVLLALLQIWNTNFLGAASHAVLAYDKRLKLLPDYLQQLEMESNGKSVRVDGEPVATHTCPLIWGGEESNGQHAFHQLLHQGTRAFSADLIACAKAAHDLPEHHPWLLANCLAQGEALRQGREAAEPHRRVAGGHPCTTILLDDLTPYALGALLAVYEHKVFCASAIWQINAFDQWGVELGKELAGPIHERLCGKGASPGRDSSTESLVKEIRRRGG